MRSKPATNHACQYLAAGILSGDFKIGGRLPAIERLAAKAHVSVHSMWQAVKQLRDDGVLNGSQGKPTVVAENCIEACKSIADSGRIHGESSAARRGSVGLIWEGAVGRIKQDILNGIYPAGSTLPYFKQLQYAYGISYPTLRKALNELVDEQYLRIVNKRYEVPSYRTPHASAGIVVCGFGGSWQEDKGKIRLGQNGHELFRLLEAECSRSGILLHALSFTFQDNGVDVWEHYTAHKTQFIANDSVLGYIYLANSYEESIDERILRIFAHIRKPIAILDDIGGWSLPPWLKSNPYVQMFTVTISRLAADRVGRYLINLGHHHCAFFSPFHQMQWSKIRLEGLVDVYASAGHANAVKSYTFDNARRRKYHNLTKDPAPLFNYYTRWKTSVSPELYKDLDKIMNTIQTKAMRTGEIRYLLSLVLEMACAEKEITAWVAVNDLTATLIMDFSREHDIRIPEDISLVSFDDTSEAMLNGLTSYNFNITGLMHQMLNHISRHGAVNKNRRRTTIAVGGSIVERRTVAPCPSRGWKFHA
ncbi:MAG: GntR family transcriptional regulator [Chitinivibrionales bacterium]|nr:GntR family transcriptional regulator [Chitinivibrionales bacterium]